MFIKWCCILSLKKYPPLFCQIYPVILLFLTLPPHFVLHVISAHRTSAPSTATKTAQPAGIQVEALRHATLTRMPRNCDF